MYLVGLLTLGIVTCIGLILVWVKRFFYQKRGLTVVSTNQRALAFFFDFIFLHFLIIFSYIIWGLSKGVLGDQITSYIILVKEIGTSRFWYDVRFVEFYMVVLYAVYAFVGELLFGTTLGKKMVGLEVEWMSSRLLSLVRNLFKIPMILLWPIGLVISVCNKKRRWGHDYISNSLVVYSKQDYRG